MIRRALILIFVCLLVRPIFGLTRGDLSRVKFEPQAGRQVSPNLEFTDENGRTIKFGDLLGQKPIILALGYYRCPMLCTQINDGLINALQNLRANVGVDLAVVDLSIEPNETPGAAADKKTLYVRRYGRPNAAAGWHCLVGDARNVAQIADEIGYRYLYDPQVNEYAHPSGIVVLTPDGKVSRYLLGVTFNSTELRDAIEEAKKGQSSSIISQVFLLCYHYNPITGKYGALILSILRGASVGVLIALGGFIARMIGRDRREWKRYG